MASCRCSERLVLAEVLILTAEEARAYAVRVLTVAGFSDEDVALCSDALVESSLRGIDSHGLVSMLPVYVDQARGVAETAGAVLRLSERGAVTVIDGEGAFGLRAGRAALTAALERATHLGVGVAVVRRVGYLGALWWSILPAAEQGHIGVATTNSMACVAPYGGREPLHGSNPIAVVVPCEPDAIVLDMRTNALRMADYWESIKTGRPLPGDSVMTPDGGPLTDAREIDSAVYLPLAGYYGYGLALVVDVLTGALSGGPIGREVKRETERDGLGAFFLVINPSFFGQRESFANAVHRLSVQVHATTPLDDAEVVRLPGERAAAERRQRLANGIPVDAELWNRMQKRLEGLGVSVRAPRFACKS